MRTIGKQQARLNYEAVGMSLPSRSSLVPTSMPSFGQVMNASIFGVVIIAVLAVFLVAVLVVPVANLTTGVTIAHTGFTPNANVTSTPGLVPIMQLYPLFFLFIGLIYIARIATEETRGI